MAINGSQSGSGRCSTIIRGGTRCLSLRFCGTWARICDWVPCWAEIRMFCSYSPVSCWSIPDILIDSVKTRLSQGEGMSFAEFSYPLLQAWDWWTMFQKGTQVQVGGSDQYGNILFGMDAVKAISRNTANEQIRNPLESELDRPIGFTTPLLTAPSGEKFGKSAGNAIWLDKDMTSTFELYQVRSPRLSSLRHVTHPPCSSSFAPPTIRWSATSSSLPSSRYPKSLPSWKSSTKIPPGESLSID